MGVQEKCQEAFKGGRTRATSPYKVNCWSSICPFKYPRALQNADCRGHCHDHLGVSAPRAESGVHLCVLKRDYTEEELAFRVMVQKTLCSLLG
jgi:hypothetical protein